MGIVEVFTAEDIGVLIAMGGFWSTMDMEEREDMLGSRGSPERP